MRKMVQLVYELKSISRSLIKSAPGETRTGVSGSTRACYGIAYIPSQTLWFRRCTRPVSLIASK